MRLYYVILACLLSVLGLVSCQVLNPDIFVDEQINNKELAYVSLVKTLCKADFPDYDFSCCQGAACYGNYVFMCLEKGPLSLTSQVVILDAETLDPICKMDTGETMHGNSLNFSYVYYTDNDEYPLLFMSNYYVMRIINDGSWSIEKVSNISSDINAPTFAIDNEQHILYLFNYTDNKGYSINRSVEKHNIIRAYDMDKYNFCQDVYLPMEEAIDEFELPYYIIGQDVACRDGFLYWSNDDLSYSQFCLMEGGIWVVDFDMKEIVKFFPYTRRISAENESIWFFRNNMYFATKGLDTLYIYQVLPDYYKPNIE